MVNPLDHKLWRNLWHMRGQAMAISLVIALGVLMLVMMDGLVNSLEETRRAYYERYRLAQVFAPVRRAPKNTLAQIAKIPGVASVETRINGAALIDLPSQDLPIQALAVSLPDFRPPRLNDVYLSAGRALNPSNEDEILLLEGFAKAHDLSPGETITATMNGARRKFTIAGWAQSPEFLFTTAPGEFIPDDARFAVFWMNETALAAAYDLSGAFNEALLSLTRNADKAAVLEQIDLLLDPYGSTGSFDLDDHISDRFISEEIEGLRVSKRIIPPIFLAVAAFLLSIVISRIVQSEREQIGLLKAFGYSSREVAIHYLKMVMVIAIIGAVLGCIGGVFAGRSLSSVYQQYYKFPFLIFQVDPGAFIIGFLVSVLSASAGGIFVLRRVFALTPAVAMRPPAPADYSRSTQFQGPMNRLLDQPSRMVLRRIIRHPARTGGAVLGIAAGMSLSLAMLNLLSSFDDIVDLNYNILDRSDLTVSFAVPLSDKALYELQALGGVIEVEPFRGVPAILHNGRNTYRGALSGLVAAPRLNRAVDKNLVDIPIRDDGVILGKALADILAIAPGEILTIEVQDGRRPVLTLPVVAIAETMIGSPAYLEMDALNRTLKEQNRIQGAFLRIDTAHSQQIYKAIKNMPAVIGVSLKSEARIAFEKLLDSNAGAMRYVMALIAGVITFGIVYNTARIAFSERARDLASLRVIGFTKAETAFVLLGEIAVVTLLALPLGTLIGHFLSYAISQGFSTDLYQIPVNFSPQSYGSAGIAVLLSAAISGWLVKRDINRLDLISALKTRE